MSTPESAGKGRVETMPKGERCPVGPLNAHTYNYERDECIWCGPNALCAKEGRWVPLGNGLNAWSVNPAEGCHVIWTTDEKPTRRCVTHERDWRPPSEPMCPGGAPLTPGNGDTTA